MEGEPIPVDEVSRITAEPVLLSCRNQYHSCDGWNRHPFTSDLGASETNRRLRLEKKRVCGHRDPLPRGLIQIMVEDLIDNS